MPNIDLKKSSPYKGSGQITREQFLFYEMRTTARLLQEGLTEEEVASRIVDENLFQYPTEKTVRKMAMTCIERLRGLDDESLIAAIANQPADIAKQICLYAMMKQYRVIWDFMVTVIGEKYRLRDMSYSRMDINSFFLRLQEQDDIVASWSETTISKIKQVITKMLIENDYLDNSKTDHLNPILICSVLENAIRSNCDDKVLCAFNCLS